MKLIKAFAVAVALTTSPIAVSSAWAANIVETAQAAGTFNTLIAAAQAAGLAEALATTDNITVFAPTDDAFAALPEGTVESLLKPENKDQLAAILTLHVLGAKVMSTDLSEGTIEADTLNPNAKLSVTKSMDGVSVMASNSAKVVSADIAADNGVIHVIDAVLLP